MKKEIQVAIDARTYHGGGDGGLQQVIIGLVSGLKEASVPHQNYHLLVAEDNFLWIKPYINERFTLVSAGRSRRHFETLKESLFKLRQPIAKIYRWFFRSKISNPFQVALSKKTYDVIHFINPITFEQTNLATVFTLCDMQHLHLPELFSEEVIRWRETAYVNMIQNTTKLVTLSKLSQKDISQHFGKPISEVEMIPLASPVSLYKSSSEASPINLGFPLPDRFLLYPALTYAHKNHLRLIEAIKQIRDENGIKISLICTGAKRLIWSEIEATIAKLELQDSVFFPGFVSENMLINLYRNCYFVVLPSLFEGVGLPCLEAMAMGSPLVASDIEAFREFAKDAPIYFDPRSISSIKASILKMYNEPGEQERSSRRGIEIAKEMSWKNTALKYIEVYDSAYQAHKEKNNIP